MTTSDPAQASSHRFLAYKYQAYSPSVVLFNLYGYHSMKCKNCPSSLYTRGTSPCAPRLHQCSQSSHTFLDLGRREGTERQAYKAFAKVSCIFILSKRIGE